VRERLGLRNGRRVRFTVEDGARAVIAPASNRLGDLAGILPKPARPKTLEEMDDTIRDAAAGRYRRSTAGAKR
jgi:bifunctional DNA-binding transcriptional regulator/antitoxin component of YhaV-PrlF toxin-antitoxin module